MAVLASQRSDWEVWEGTKLVRTGMTNFDQARDLVRIAANPIYFIKHYTTEEEVRWSDVCSEGWPTYPDDPNNLYDEEWYPYGGPPSSWPYGNAC